MGYNAQQVPLPQVAEIQQQVQDGSNDVARQIADEAVARVQQQQAAARNAQASTGQQK